MEISTVTHAGVTTHNTHILIDTRHNSSHPDTLLYWTFYFDFFANIVHEMPKNKVTGNLVAPCLFFLYKNNLVWLTYPLQRTKQNR